MSKPRDASLADGAYREKGAFVSGGCLSCFQRQAATDVGHAGMIWRTIRRWYSQKFTH